MSTRLRCTALLLALLAGLTSIANAQFTPQWRVGDWWVVKTLENAPGGRRWWRLHRYDVLGMEQVNGHNCYVLKSSIPGGEPEGCGELYHIRPDSLLPVRLTHIWAQSGELLPPAINDYPEGIRGPECPDLRLPCFPLDVEYTRDTAFTLQKRAGSWWHLRDVSRGADTAEVRRFLDAGDSSGRRVIRPAGGRVYVVRSEAGGGARPPLPPPPGRPWPKITRTLQVWSEDWPWCLYEERVFIDNDRRTTTRGQRFWLVAVGHDQR